MPLGVGGHPQQIGVLNATPGIFSVLDSAPQLGRAFAPEEAQPGHEHVVVLMDSLWRQAVSRRSRDSGQNHHAQRISLHRDRRHAAVVPSASIADLSQRRSRIIRSRLKRSLPMAFYKDQLQEVMGDFNYFGLAG